MDRVERAVLVGSAMLMAVFFAALIYSAVRLKITVPTCVTNRGPFTKGQIIDKGNHQYEVQMVAKMWAFDPPEVRLPPGADVDLYLSALDVTHGLYIEHTDVNLMAVPGAVNFARVRFDKPGEYNVICHEYCGAGHQLMMGKFIIAPGAVVAPVGAAPATGAGGTGVSAGQRIFEEKGCGACHSTDGSPNVGPTVKGLYGSTVEFADGSHRIADEEFLEEFIHQPGKLIVKGFQPIMPGIDLTPQQMHELIAYLKSLA
jgi:cytochrome c oxidase subunit 2